MVLTVGESGIDPGAEPLRVGTGRTDITPRDGFPRPHWGGQVLASQGFVRPLLCTATVFRKGPKSVALVSLDICAIRSSLVDQMGLRLKEEIQGPFHLVVNCSHSHEAPFLAEPSPDRLVTFYEARLVEAVRRVVAQAWNDAEPAGLSFYAATVSGLNRNRRRPRAAVDRNLSLLRVDGVSGNPIAALWHFTAHPLTNLGLEKAWSPDFPGFANGILERCFEGCQFQYLQGALGDVFPLDWHFRQKRHRYPTNGETEQLMGEKLAMELIGHMKRCQPMAVERLAWADREIQLRGRRIPFRLEKIEALLRSLEPHVDASRFEPWTPGDHAVNVAQRHEVRYQLLALRLLRRMKLEEDSLYRCPLSAVQLGPLAMATIPGELFSREGLILRKSSRPLPCLALGCSNGYLSYIPSIGEARMVEGWDLHQWIDQRNNRWAYGATITTYLAAEAAPRILGVLSALLRELRPYQNHQ